MITPNPRLIYLRLPLMLSVAGVLLLSLWTGLQRLGWSLDPIRPGLSGIHGPLMVCGVMGTLICLERAVAFSLHSKNGFLPYLAPLLSGAGGILLVLGTHDLLARFLIVLGSIGLVTMGAEMIRRHSAPFTFVMGLGGFSWWVGNVLWLSGQPVYQVVYCWIAFLVLTIVGERLELSRVTRLTVQSQRLFMAATAVFGLGVVLTIFHLDLGVRVIGIGSLALALWLLRYDIARQTVKRAGLPRFIAVCLLTGYGWLGFGGVIAIWVGASTGGIYYETLLHAMLLGFVFSMIFGHAPIIIPALTGRAIVFRKFFYSYVILLHVSLLIREMSNLMLWMPGRQWGGFFNVMAVLLFMASTIGAVIYSKRD